MLIEGLLCGCSIHSVFHARIFVVAAAFSGISRILYMAAKRTRIKSGSRKAPASEHVGRGK